MGNKEGLVELKEAICLKSALIYIPIRGAGSEDLQNLGSRATLKKSLFPVQWPGGYFLNFYCIFSPKKVTRISYQNFWEKKQHKNFGHPLDRKQTFF